MQKTSHEITSKPSHIQKASGTFPPAISPNNDEKSCLIIIIIIMKRDQ